jgi:protein subunit release factor A
MNGEETESATDWLVEFLHVKNHGGMQVPKMPRAVRVTHLPTGITHTCDEHRHAHLNRQAAFDWVRADLCFLEGDK